MTEQLRHLADTCTAIDGEKKNCTVLQCPCGSCAFFIIWIEDPACGCDEDLSHLQCFKCGVSYCTQKMDEEARQPTGS